MSKVYTATTREADDGSGDMIVDLPPELVEQLGWKEGDILQYELIEGAIHVKKKDDGIKS